MAWETAAGDDETQGESPSAPVALPTQFLTQPESHFKERWGDHKVRGKQVDVGGVRNRFSDGIPRFVCVPHSPVNSPIGSRVRGRR